MKTVAAIGELLIDFVPLQKGLALKEVPAFERVPGGAPANAAKAVARLGGRALMLSQVGQDAFGDVLLEDLARSGVDTRGVCRTGRANTGLAFVSLDAGGNRDFCFFRNPSADLFYAPDQLDAVLLADCGALHFCSVDLVDSPMRQTHRRAVELARQVGAFVSFDPNVRLPLWPSAADCRQAIREFLPLADLVKLSDDEVAFVTGCAQEPQAAARLLAQGAGLVVVTRGAQGAAAYTRTGRAEVATAAVPEVVDTTGAGDSFIGSLLWQLVRDGVGPAGLAALDSAALTRYLTFSSRYASLTVQKKGAVMATLAEMRAAFGT